MKNFFVDHFNNNFPLTPPFIAEQKLAIRFPNATSTIWFKQGETYAVIFSAENSDCMAIMNNSYEITTYKIKLNKERLPNNILHAAANLGNIINAVSIWNKGLIHYELTYIDVQLSTLTIQFDSNGNIIRNA